MDGSPKQQQQQEVLDPDEFKSPWVRHYVETDEDDVRRLLSWNFSDIWGQDSDEYEKRFVREPLNGNIEEIVTSGISIRDLEFLSFEQIKKLGANREDILLKTFEEDHEYNAVFTQDFLFADPHRTISDDPLEVVKWAQKFMDVNRVVTVHFEGKRFVQERNRMENIELVFISIQDKSFICEVNYIDLNR